MSSTNVGRPVSLPNALAKLLLPLPGTPKRRTPRGLTFLLSCSAREQKLLRLESPPKDANDSLPRCSRRRLVFLRACALRSQITCGRKALCLVSDNANEPSAS